MPPTLDLRLPEVTTEVSSIRSDRTTSGAKGLLYVKPEPLNEASKLFCKKVEMSVSDPRKGSFLITPAKVLNESTLYPLLSTPALIK